MASASRRRPEVIVEFLLDDELLFLAVRNIGDAPAMRVRVRPEPSIRVLAGQLDVGRLALLRQLEMLGPGRQIRPLIDRGPYYLAPQDPRAGAATAPHDDPAAPR